MKEKRKTSEKKFFFSQTQAFFTLLLLNRIFRGRERLNKKSKNSALFSFYLNDLFWQNDYYYLIFVHFGSKNKTFLTQIVHPCYPRFRYMRNFPRTEPPMSACTQGIAGLDCDWQSIFKVGFWIWIFNPVFSFQSKSYKNHNFCQ